MIVVSDEDCTEKRLECAVCLQQCVHPVMLPCSHIFCYLCVKGVANRSKRCALCRTDIPADFVNKPKLVCKNDLLNSSALDDGTQWFYAGNSSGWWRYDPRTNRDIEEKFKEGAKKFEILIAGYLYVIDLEQMIQYRHSDMSRKRNIKRDMEDSIATKGVAGLMHNKDDDSVARESADGDGETQHSTAVTSATATSIDSRNNNRALIFPSPITHLSPQLEREVSSTDQTIVDRIRDLQLGDNNPRHYIPRRLSDSATRYRGHRRGRERPPLTSLGRMNTDSEDSD